MPAHGNLSEAQCLEIGKSMFSNRPRNEVIPAKKAPGKKAPAKQDPLHGKMVAVGVQGRVASWSEEKGFGCITTPELDHGEGDIARVFCYNRGFVEACQVHKFVMFDLWQHDRSRKLEAVNITESQITSIDVATAQLGTIKQWHEIEGEDGKVFRCGKDDFDHQSYFRRHDKVRFDTMWLGHGQVRAVNIRPAWSQEEWDQWRAEKAVAVEDSDDDGASTVASTIAAPLPAPAAPAPAPAAAKSVRGRVKVFLEEKDHGFIALESGTDVFFHVKSLDEGVSVKRNDTVAVSISEDRWGKMHVNHVDLIKKATSKVHGRVKVFFEEKDYGFIALESGSEVFFHTRSLDAGVSVGRNDIVEVIVSEDASGKLRVSHVELIKRATLMRLLCRNPKCLGKQHFEDRCPLGVFVPTR